ncbi:MULTISPECIES: branched-chain amino acid ABC transporter permease [Archaeoglobus]|jgi:branched-chain amino acid transport system permease protein|uniref:Branched-chain amino acid ABC transporter, permease protein (BraD-1) n=3 Tax=Archaeoglobus fulgidus TaxID=2234 RepID=O30015_ARCFU|nr:MULTISPECIES: branched-chain amino acid ABC transporter permease [Archaeoglobus]AAB91008.1 branched-chain amino acid ABC transporter, permease protein (braD-1) [Archaeoglobus fulgidus DSM 4304]AIG97042.1 Branched-chain amino acid ABC-type transport system, permease component [Archaeoglobus fulgidus DSM 8774]MDI3497724.1 branched-chain amino acid transport system permease protein [Archaeoglobus sp.]
MIETLVKIAVFGAVVGGIWGLVASGFSLIFGVSRILNFAHGAAFVSSAFLAYALISEGYNLYLAILAGLLLSALIGLAVYALTKPVRDREVMVIILTLAFALLVQQVLLVLYGDRGVSIEPFVSGFAEIGGVKVTYMRILSFVLAVLCLTALEVFVTRTKLGKKVIATAQDSRAAMMVGIDIEKIFLLVMVLSSVLAGFAGILYAQIFAVSPEVSLRALIYAFAIVILGGLGSLRGSVVASFIVGYILVTTITFLGARWSEFVMLLTIVAILIVKPTGLFGVEE